MTDINNTPQMPEPNRSSENEPAPLDRGENRSTARVTLLAAMGQAFLAGLAGEAAHWLVQGAEWLASLL
ncbi:hypothetical protein ACFQ7B_35630 [Streptomyces erythrochromogenes]|uniref:hypothetical protein n=1 Tax=Streptomyces erythrochromogenes TaxID=285574 RepID=UPI0036C00835